MKQGIFLLLIAMTLTPGVDALAKIMGQSHAPFQVAFLRFLAAGTVALVAARLAGISVRVPRSGWFGQVIRTALLAAATTCLVFALTLVPLAYAAGGFLIAPIVSTLLGVIFLGEMLTLQRVLGAGLAFAGAVIITDPAVSLQIGSIFALVGGTFLGIYLVATRCARNPGHPLATLAVQCLLGAAMIAPFALIDGLPVVTTETGFLTLGLGILAATTHVLTVAAYERADTTVLAPFLYFNLLVAVILGLVVFGEMPSGVAMIGLAAIAGGGILSATTTLNGQRPIWARTAAVR